MARLYKSVPTKVGTHQDGKKNAPRMRGVLGTTYAGDQPW